MDWKVEMENQSNVWIKNIRWKGFRLDRNVVKGQRGGVGLLGEVMEE